MFLHDGNNSSANSATASPAITDYIDNQEFIFSAFGANGGSMTIDIDSRRSQY